VRFPLGDWIDEHERCRYNLGASGMRGTVRHPLPTAREVRLASESELRARFADRWNVDATRVFLTHGATEANALVVTFLTHRSRGRRRRVRLELPEYPPLVDLVRLAGYRRADRSSTAELAVVSRPKNPIGNRSPLSSLAAWAEGTRATLVDETFREFSGAPSAQGAPVSGLWTTGSMTKVYGADDLRVGFLVAPEEEAAGYERFHGNVADELPPYSVAGAIRTLDEAPRLLREVREVVGRNQAIWRRARPAGPELAAPFAFDDPVPWGGDRWARRCLEASVLVCPGSFFGRPSGVRVGLTRRTFPRDFAAYERVRAASAGARGRITAAGENPPGRPRRGAGVRAGAGRR
jgi:aspartate/methionine/tyrosine aminotransferase